MNNPTTKFSVTLSLIFSISLTIHSAADAADLPSNQICSKYGALGLKFGDKFSGEKIQGDSFLFAPGCYLFKPTTTLPYFDTYAACTSNINGKIYQIQAAKEYDTHPPKGSMSLTDEQVAANRDQGQQALDGMLALFPKEMAERVNVNVEGRSWQMPIDGGTTLDVSNSVSWSLTFECRNEEMALKEFKYRTGTR